MMKFSQNILFKIGMKWRLRQKNILSQKISQNWNEFAAEAENVIVVD